LPAVEVVGLAKRFRDYPGRQRSLREVLSRAYRRLPELVRRPGFELEGLELVVAPGEWVAFVGDNGSGKSTALRLIAGIYAPCAGQVRVRGRLAAVIELGAGLQAELSGLENIALSGAVMGLRRAELAALEPAVAEFAQLGEFIELPVKYFSSGMRARLAFSIALCAQPQILLLDEVLAVGDRWFRERCFERLERFRAQGRTLIAVSHESALLRRLCERAVWFERGRVRMSGPCAAVLDAYAAAQGRA
jgi:ABC-type polysaccharide/polyol phosphate transport system ATPase subunit